MIREWRIEEVAFERLAVLPEMQVRVDKELDPENVERCKEGAVNLPEAPAFDDGVKIILAGGFHRYQARFDAGFGTLRCKITKGTDKDAFLYSRGENADNGLPRTSEDKRNAVLSTIAKNDAENCGWSDRLISESCKVNHDYVSHLRRETAKLPDSGKKEPAGSKLPDADDALHVNQIVQEWIADGTLSGADAEAVTDLGGDSNPAREAKQSQYVRRRKSGDDHDAAMESVRKGGKREGPTLAATGPTPSGQSPLTDEEREEGKREFSEAIGALILALNKLRLYEAFRSVIAQFSAKIEAL